MDHLIVWHRDMKVEIRAADALTSDITDPTAVDALPRFLSQVEAVVDRDAVDVPVVVHTGELPWQSRPLPADTLLEGPHGTPVTAPAGGSVQVSCAMTLQLRPRALRSHRPSYDLSDVRTSVVVSDAHGGTIGQLSVPLATGRSFLDPAGLPLPGLLGGVVEALALACFPAQSQQARDASAPFDDWDELCRRRVGRLRLWQAQEACASTWPSRAAHELRLPMDLFVRPEVFAERPSGRRVTA